MNTKLDQKGPESFWPNFEIMTSQHETIISRFWENSFITNTSLESSLFFYHHELRVLFFKPILGWWRHHVKSKLKTFLEDGFIHDQISSRYLFLLVFIFLSTLVYEISIWTFLTHFGLITSSQRVSFWPNFGLMTLSRESELQYFEKWSQKQILHFKVLSNIGFNLSITIDTWYTTLGPFYPIRRFWHHKRSKYSSIL